MANPTKPSIKKPRSLQEIQNAYFECRQRAGDFQYQRYLLSKELRKLNKDMIALNQEAAARQKMDGEQKPKEAAKETVPAEGATNE